MRWGKHCVKSWFSTQATVALSSAEAKLYALTKGAAQALGIMTMLLDLGAETNATIHADASAAIRIVRRTGLGKLRHLNVRDLWLQDQLKGDNMKLTKVAGTENPSDIVTKHFGATITKGHLERLCMRACGGRAATAPTVASVIESVHAPDASAPHRHNRADVVRTESLEQFTCADLSHAEESESDQWIEAPTYCVRIHESSRNCFFTPPRVAGIPPRQALAAVRITEGCYVDNGEEFRTVDNWSGRSAHRVLQRRWTGRTTFLRVSLLNHTFL